MKLRGIPPRTYIAIVETAPGMSVGIDAVDQNNGFRPIARAQILPGTVRAYPALADGLLYARDEETLVCVRLN